MKKRIIPCILLCMLAAQPLLAEPSDTFFEASMALTRAARLEKEGDYKAAMENCQKASRILQTMKKESPDWNPSWVVGKLDNASQLQQKLEPLAKKAPAPKAEDYSLKPGEWRDVTFERAYKAHDQKKFVVPSRATAAPAPSSASSPVKGSVPAVATGQPETRPETRALPPQRVIIMPRPVYSPQPAPRTVPHPPRDGRFRIGG